MAQDQEIKDEAQAGVYLTQEDGEKTVSSSSRKSKTLAISQVVVAFIVIFNTQGYFNSFGVYQAYYTAHLQGTSQSTISWIGSVQVWLVFGLGSVSGRAVDLGWFHFVFLAGLIIQVTGIFLASISTTFWQVFLSHGICVGFGSGLMFAPTLAVVTSYFPEKRTIALAYATCGGASGGVIFPLLVQNLIPQLGLSWTLRVIGFFMLVSLTIAWLMARPQVARQGKKQKLSLSDIKEPSYLLFAASAFFCFWALYFGYYYISIQAREELGFSYSDSTSLVLELNAVGIPPRLLAAYLADGWLGPQFVFLYTLLSAAITLYCWIPVNTSTGIYIWTAIYGIVAGIIQTLFLAVSSSFAKDPASSGFRLGLVCTIISFAALTGPPLGGAIIQAGNGSYVNGDIWAGTTMMVSFCILAVARQLTTVKALVSRLRGQ